MDDFLAKLAAMEAITGDQVQAALKAVGKELKLGGKKVFMPVRVALTGKMHGRVDLGGRRIIKKKSTVARIRNSMSLVK
jgi:nondiscriminating glutamyl-tRNA synthetase